MTSPASGSYQRAHVMHPTGSRRNLPEDVRSVGCCPFCRGARNQRYLAVASPSPPRVPSSSRPCELSVAVLVPARPFIEKAWSYLQRPKPISGVRRIGGKYTVGHFIKSPRDRDHDRMLSAYNRRHLDRLTTHDGVQQCKSIRGRSTVVLEGSSLN